MLLDHQLHTRYLGNVLICSSNDTMSGRVIPNDVTIWLSLQSSTVILQDPLVSCKDQMGEFNGMWGITTTASFRSLMVALIFATLPRMQYCIWFTISLGRSSFSGFSLDLSHHNSPHSTGQRTCVGILTVAGYVYSNHTFQCWGNNHKMDLDIHWCNCEADLS